MGAIVENPSLPEQFLLALSERDLRLVRQAAALDEDDPATWVRRQVMMTARARLRDAGVVPARPRRSKAQRRM